MLLLYFPQGADARVHLMPYWSSAVPARKDRFDFIGPDSHEQGKPFEAYPSFISDDRLNVSDSAWVKGTSD